MTKVDVIVIGAGAAGLSAAALLAKEGKKRRRRRGRAPPRRARHGGARRGLQAQPGWPPAGGLRPGITKVFDYVGKKLEHGAVSSDMPVWDHVKERWGSIRDRYSGDKSELKKVIRALARRRTRSSTTGTTARCASGCSSTPPTRA